MPKQIAPRRRHRGHTRQRGHLSLRGARGIDPDHPRIDPRTTQDRHQSDPKCTPSRPKSANIGQVWPTSATESRLPKQMFGATGGHPLASFGRDLWPILARSGPHSANVDRGGAKTGPVWAKFGPSPSALCAWSWQGRSFVRLLSDLDEHGPDLLGNTRSRRPSAAPEGVRSRILQRFFSNFTVCALMNVRAIALPCPCANPPGFPPSTDDQRAGGSGGGEDWGPVGGTSDITVRR